MFLSPRSRSPLLLVGVAALILGTSLGGAFFVSRALTVAIPEGARLMFLSFAAMCAALALALLAAAHAVIRGSLLWRNEQDRIIGEPEFSGAATSLPLSGPCQVIEHRLAAQDGVAVRTFLVCAPSADLGKVVLWSGSDPQFADRWRKARVTPSPLSVLEHPPVHSGISQAPRGQLRLPGGWGITGVLLTWSLLCLCSPLMMVLCRFLIGSGLKVWAEVIGGLVAAGVSYVTMRQFSTVEIEASPERLRYRRSFRGLILKRAADLPCDVLLNLSHYPWVSLDHEQSGEPALKIYSSSAGPTLTGVIWLTATLRRRDSL